MSLSKAQTRIKEGFKQVQSLEGIKKTAVHIGIGVALGAILDIILTYIMQNFVYPYLREASEDPAGWTKPIAFEGSSIFPDQTNTYYEELFLVLITIFLLFTKKFWIVLGFGLGWYTSKYFGLYLTMKLPTWQEITSPTP